MTITTEERIRGALFDAFVLILLVATTMLGLSLVWASADVIVYQFERNLAASEIALMSSMYVLFMLLGIAIAVASVVGAINYVAAIRKRAINEKRDARQAVAEPVEGE